MTLETLSGRDIGAGALAALFVTGLCAGTGSGSQTLWAGSAAAPVALRVLQRQSASTAPPAPAERAEPAHASTVTLDQLVGLLQENIPAPLVSEFAGAFAAQPALREALTRFRREDGGGAEASRFVARVAREPEFRALVARFGAEPSFQRAFAAVTADARLRPLVRRIRDARAGLAQERKSRAPLSALRDTSSFAGATGSVLHPSAHTTAPAAATAAEVSAHIFALMAPGPRASLETYCAQNGCPRLFEGDPAYCRAAGVATDCLVAVEKYLAQRPRALSAAAEGGAAASLTGAQSKASSVVNPAAAGNAHAPATAATGSTTAGQTGGSTAAETALERGGRSLGAAIGGFFDRLLGLGDPSKGGGFAQSLGDAGAAIGKALGDLATKLVTGLADAITGFFNRLLK